jgi:hypothetical protein
MCAPDVTAWLGIEVRRLRCHWARHASVLVAVGRCQCPLQMLNRLSIVAEHRVASLSAQNIGGCVFRPRCHNSDVRKSAECVKCTG